jgi:hypothetical protein
MILALTTVVYARVSTAYFCGYDDFLEVGRADFVDRIEPAKIFTTFHFDSFKYRPLNRLSTLVSYLIHPNDALAFRIRNLFFHLAAVVMVYLLAMLLFQSWPVAAIAALLFSVHPLANQVVVGAVMSNTEANALFLLALVLFIFSLQRSNLGLMAVALICGAVSVYVYESSIVIPGIMVMWWALDYLFTRRLPERRFVVVFVVLGGVLFGSYLIVRHQLNPGGHTPVFGPPVIVKGMAEYGVALVSPVNLMLAHQWFGMPLPGAISPDEIEKFVFIAAAVGFGLLLLLAHQFRRIVDLLARAGWQPMLFLLLGIGLALAPFLVFTDHVSETYCYLPVALFSLLLARLLAFIPSRGALIAVIAVLVGLSASATWIRNGRVYACGSTAHRLLSGLPLADWKQGEFHILVAKTPGTVDEPRFGLFNYSGLDTIDPEPPHANGKPLGALESAVQLATGNPNVHVRIDTAEELPARCADPTAGQCFWIHPDGAVSRLKP